MRTGREAEDDRHSAHPAPPARPAPRAAAARADGSALSRGRAAPAYPDGAAARRRAVAAPPLAAVDRVGRVHRALPGAPYARRSAESRVGTEGVSNGRFRWA